MSHALSYSIVIAIIVINGALVLLPKWLPDKYKSVLRSSLPPDDPKLEPPRMSESEGKQGYKPPKPGPPSEYVTVPLSREERRWITMKRGFIMVVALYALDLLVLYILSLMGGPISGSGHGI